MRHEGNEDRVSLGKSILLDLGMEDYLEILKLQRHLNFLSSNGEIADAVILLQHPDVYTLGIHRNQSEILAPGVVPFEVERGGSATYHGPGQLVAYFMVNMKNHGINVRDLIQMAQNSIISLLADYGIIAEGRLQGETGVWVKNRKICSIGFAVKGFSTLHGIGFNVNTDLSKFQKIMPCGMQSSIMTSMENELGHAVDFINVKNRLKNSFTEMLGIKKYIEFNSMDELKSYSVGNGLGLLPEELL